MSQINYAPGLSLGLVELRRMFDFLDKDGFRKSLLQNTSSFGLIKGINNGFLNGKISEDISSSSNGLRKVIISPLTAIDSLGRCIQTKKNTSISIPVNNQWYWLQIKHSYSNIEEGSFSIDIDGNLTASGVDLTTIFKGGSDTPTKLSFPNSTVNIQEYEVIEVLGSNNAILSGDFVAEVDINIAIVGSFVSNQVPTSYKYPFQFDNATITLIPESNVNAVPAHIENQEFFLARVRSTETKLIIQDKRSLFIYKTKADNTITPTLISNIREISLLGVEHIKFESTNNLQINSNNTIRLGWGLRSNDWNVSLETNTLNITSIIAGGKFKTIQDFSLINISGWKVIAPNGEIYSAINSVVSGGVLHIALDTFDASSISIDTGYLSNEGIFTIIPNINSISFRFKRSYLKDGINIFADEIVSNYIADVGYVDISIPVIEDKTYYSIEYKQHYLIGSSPWELIPSDTEVGYFQEKSFDGYGKRVLIPTTKTYTATSLLGFIEFNINTDSYSNFKKDLNKNKYGVDYASFSGSNDILKLIPGQDSVFQIFSQSNSLSSSSSIIYIDLSTLSILNGSFFTLQFYNNIVIGDKIVNIGYNFGSSISNRLVGATVLKQISSRDIAQSKNIDGGIRFDCFYDGVNWVISQNYEVGKKGEVVLFHGNSGLNIGEDGLWDCFDYGSGLGKAFGWIGYALCDGRSNTPDLRGRFVVGYDVELQGSTDYNTIGHTGGEAFHTLSVPEMPSEAYSVALNIGNRGTDTSGDSMQHLSVVPKNPTNGTKTYPIDSGGQNKPHENRPPYIVLAYAKRIY